MVSALNSQSSYQIMPEKELILAKKNEISFCKKKKENFHVISDTAVKAKIASQNKFSSLSKNRHWRWKWVEGGGFDQSPMKLCIIDKTQVEFTPGLLSGLTFPAVDPWERVKLHQMCRKVGG